MELEVSYIDAFAEKSFEGNPAAVIYLDSWLDNELMQKIATENNLSETAFIVSEGSKFHIRWFSPICEIDFCGHATLASAKVFFSKNKERESITFYARAVGDIEVIKVGVDLIQMSFPNRLPYLVTDVPEALFEGLSILPQAVYKNNQAFIAVYKDEREITQVVANSHELKKLAPFDVSITAQSSEYDFVSRYFWPANGGDEDPVTGSIHAGLVPLWGKTLNKTELIAKQVSARGGVLYCSVANDTVNIAGKAQTYMRGKIYI